MKYKIGMRVRFTGFKSSSFDYPKISIGEIGEVVSVKNENQFGHDYHVKMQNGTFGFNESELDSN